MKVLAVMGALALAACGAPESGSRLLDEDVTPQAFFEEEVLPNLEDNCESCHGNPAPDYESALTQIVPGSPEESSLYLYATGEHDHRRVWRTTSKKAKVLAKWINMEPVAAEE